MNTVKITEYWNPGCVPCAMIKGRLMQLESDYPNLKTEFHQISDFPEVVEKYDVLSAPIVVIEINGEETYGGHPNNPTEFLKTVEKILADNV